MAIEVQWFLVSESSSCLILFIAFIACNSEGEVEPVALNSVVPLSVFC